MSSGVAIPSTREALLGFDEDEFRRFLALPVERRYRVLDRAALIVDGTGCDWATADKRALAEEELRKGASR